jgi:hypothetical protein
MRTRKAPLQQKSIFAKIKHQFLNSETGQHTLHILNCIRYLFVILLAGFIIHTSWNAAMIAWFNGQYQISLFEAAILWACIY